MTYVDSNGQATNDVTWPWKSIAQYAIPWKQL